MNGEREPTAVVMEMDDGSVVETVYATRFQAEMFLYLLSYGLSAVEDGGRVRSAILSPLAVAKKGDETPRGLS